MMMAAPTSKISMARSLTSKPPARKKSNPDGPGSGNVGRSGSLRGSKSFTRSLISGPVHLFAGSNVLSFQAAAMASPAQDEKPKKESTRKISSSSSAASTTSSNDSDLTSLSCNTNESETSTDASSIENSPTSAEPVEPNHLSCYFRPPPEVISPPSTSTSSPSSTSPSDASPTDSQAPAIPQRVPSHSKRAHERKHRQRSIQRTLVDVFDPARPSLFTDAKPHHDHSTVRHIETGSELPQLKEVAEDVPLPLAPVAILDADAKADLDAITSRGLACFNVKDYAAEINILLFQTFYEEDTTWI